LLHLITSGGGFSGAKPTANQEHFHAKAESFPEKAQRHLTFFFAFFAPLRETPLKEEYA
jgi:hypothetical protein